MMKQFTVLVVFLIAQVNAKTLLPSYVTPCDYSAKDLEDCIKKQIDQNLSKFAKGVPELNLDPLDPVNISDVILDQKNLKLTFAKNRFAGLSKVKVTDLRVDLGKKDSFFSIKFIGNLSLTTYYTADGQILILPIKGQGDGVINATDVEVEINVTLKHVKNKDNAYHLKLHQPNYKYNIGFAEIKLNNLFGGNKELGETITKFINENWKQLIDEIAPPAIKEIVVTIIKSIKKFFGAIPNDQLFVNYSGPTA